MALRYSIVTGFVLCLIFPSFAKIQASEKVTKALQIIDQVGPQGRGSKAASQAAEKLVQEGIEILPELFAHMDTDNLVSANWCRYVYQQIVAKELAKPNPQIPTDFLRCLLYTSPSPRD